jgi:hypothetical protein
LIIDSKCTIAAAERYHAAADDEARAEAQADIVTSVKCHVDEIKAADYLSSVKSAFPCVLMYIPMEEVYMLAMKATVVVSGERELLRDYARRRNVVFVNFARDPEKSNKKPRPIRGSSLGFFVSGCIKELKLIFKRRYPSCTDCRFRQ